MDAMVGVVLAGGGSTRMGTNKALLELGGVPLIERVLRTLQPLFPEVAIVANDPAPYARLGVPTWPDAVPLRGPLGGVYTAILRSRTPYTFCIACDMPFANQAMVAFLCDLVAGYQVVVPRTPDGYQPLHAVYGKECLARIETMIAADRLKIDLLFPAVRARVVEEAELRAVEPSLRCFMNVNTPEELKAAARLAGFDRA